MTVFGIIWCIFAMVCIFSGKNKDILRLICFSMIVQSSNILYIGSKGVGPQTICSILIIILVIVKNKIRFIKINSTNIGLVLPLAVIFLECTFFAGKENMLRVIQLGVYMLCFLLIPQLAFKDGLNAINKVFRELTIFVLIIGAIQILMTSGIIPKLHIFRMIFFNDPSETIAFNNTTRYVRITSVFQEPSYCGCFLTASFYFFLSKYKKNTKTLILLAVILIEIILTFSSTAYGAFGVIGILFLLFSDNKEVKKIMVPLTILGLVSMFILYYDVLDQVLFSKNLSGSFRVRSGWNGRALESFINSPLIGEGYKTVRASSLALNILGELGILGMVSYLFFILRVIYEKNETKISHKFNLHKPETFALISVIIGQLIACPDLDFCVFWLMLYIVNLSFKTYRIYQTTSSDKLIKPI